MVTLQHSYNKNDHEVTMNDKVHDGFINGLSFKSIRFIIVILKIFCKKI